MPGQEGQAAKTKALYIKNEISDYRLIKEGIAAMGRETNDE